MYAEFFGLRELPFNNSPDPRFFYSTPDHEEALASLIYAVQERKGFVLLTGEVGAGKTLLSRMMLQHFGNRIVFASIHHAVQGAADLIESLGAEFGIPMEAGATYSRHVRAVQDFLLARFSEDRPVVLVLDEAQALSTEGFEQVRMFGNLEADDAKLLQVVILGQPELQRRFATPELRQLRQRVFRTFHLPALDRYATGEYIRHRLAVAGAPRLNVFEGTAVDVVFAHAHGLPRLINAICDNSMLSAYSADRQRIDGEFVKSVVEQMMTLGAHGGPFPTEVERPDFAEPHRPVSSPGHGAPHDPPAATISPEIVNVLATRIAELESRLRDERDAAVRHEAAEQREAECGLAPDSREEVVRLEQDLQAKADQTRRSLAELQSEASGIAALLAEMRTTRSAVEAVVQIARAAEARLESGCRAVAQREGQALGTTARLKALMEESRPVVESLKRVATQAQHVERRVRRTQAQLRNRSAAVRPTFSDPADYHVERIAAESACAPLPAVAVVCDSRVPAADGTDASPVRVDPDRLRSILRENRARLADLRILVERGQERHPDGHNRRPKPTTRSSGSSPYAATARLAQRVESLMDLMSAGVTPS